MNKEKITYTIMVQSCNSWHTDGSPVIERDCGHRHRTLSGAARCLHKLYAYDRKTDMHSAAWHRADIYHSDQSSLTHREELLVERIEQ